MNNQLCRMFNLPPHVATEKEIAEYVRLSRETRAEEKANNSHLDAMNWVFGQHLTHDIVNQDTAMHGVQNNVSGLNNARTNRIDLDSLYGVGAYAFDGNRFKLGEKIDDRWHDLLRIDGVAVIPDKRNDENVLISQLQVLLQVFHNKVVDMLYVKNKTLEKPLTDDEIFTEAKNLVTWTYQKATVEWMQELTLVDISYQNDKPLDLFRLQDKMAIEFTGGVLRLHSQVNGKLKFNKSHKKPISLFGKRDSKLIPFRDHTMFVDWDLFVGDDAQRAMRIDNEIVKEMRNMPIEIAGKKSAHITERNIRSGMAYGLPSGEAIARCLGFDDVPDGDTPLFWYINDEADRQHNGERLGSVGSAILQVSIWNLLVNDDESFINVHTNWQPEIEIDTAFAGVSVLRGIVDFVRSS